MYFSESISHLQQLKLNVQDVEIQDVEKQVVKQKSMHIL
jgi:hypothetical protein